MPKFLAGRHYNEEEISRHLNKNIGYWPIQMNGNKFATGEIQEKPVEVVKERILAGWAQKSHEPCSNAYLMPAFVVYHFVTREVIGPWAGPTLAQWGHVN